MRRLVGFAVNLVVALWVGEGGVLILQVNHLLNLVQVKLLKKSIVCITKIQNIGNDPHKTKVPNFGHCQNLTPQTPMKLQTVNMIQNSQSYNSKSVLRGPSFKKKKEKKYGFYPNFLLDKFQIASGIFSF